MASLWNVIHHLKPIGGFVVALGITGLIIYKIPVTGKQQILIISYYERYFQRELNRSQVNYTLE